MPTAMPVTRRTEDVYLAIEQACDVVGVPYARHRVEPVLSAFGTGVSEESVVVLAMAGGDQGGDLDYNFTIPTESFDPYRRAVDEGLIEATNHPVSTLLADIADRCRVSLFGVECGVVEGFKKTYVFFPLDELGDLDVLATIPSMPPSVAEHAETYSRLGLSKRISIIGIDYRRHTMNIYFMAGSLDQAATDAVLVDANLPQPEDPELAAFITGSFSLYPTFSWGSPDISRLCFSSVSPDPHAYPTRLFPEMAAFAAQAPHEYEGPTVLVYGPTITAKGVYHKLGAYFRRPDSFWDQLPLAATFERLAAAGHHR